MILKVVLGVLVFDALVVLCLMRRGRFPFKWRRRAHGS